ncbi:MAG TPA: chemotaxis protein CheB, partial [Blastocatellia bacterium]|nr:chemotaxis protein CheB [Blastocatellia bacterium]
MKALEMGAVDFICKPRGNSRIGEMGDELVSKVKAAARGRLIAPAVIPPPVARPKRPLAPLPLRTASEKLVAIGASSGGPNALRFLLPRIPADFDAGIVVVQHMPESFTAVMAKWLDEICEVEVKEASDGDIALPGRVFIAPGSAHMKIRRSAQGPVVELDRGGPVNGHRPSVDVLFWSVAAQYGKRAAAVLMTGMGSDGAEGIGEIRRAGGMTLAQDKETSAIFGMPRAAIERGYVEKVAPLAEIAPWLINIVGRSQSSEGAQDGKHN